MNDRERFANWVRFRDVDRPVRWEWAFRADTTELWYRQGLPKNVPSEIGWVEYFCLDGGSPFVADSKPTTLGVNTAPKPGFEALCHRALIVSCFLIILLLISII